MADIIEYETCSNKVDFKRDGLNERIRKWHGKKMYGQFVREIPETTDSNETWQ